MSYRDGPKVTLTATCSGCKHCTTEDYYYEDGNSVDDGCKVYCTHPETRDQSGQHHEKLRIADTRWDTPPWCPLLKGAVTECIRKIQEGE